MRPSPDENLSQEPYDGFRQYHVHGEPAQLETPVKCHSHVKDTQKQFNHDDIQRNVRSRFVCDSLVPAP